MESIANHSRSAFLLVAFLLGILVRIVPWRSGRCYGAAVFAVVIAIVEICAVISRDSIVLAASMVLGGAFMLYFICLLVLKSANVPPWTIGQRMVMSVFAFAVMLPTWFVDLHTPLWRHRVRGCETFPAEILGLQTSVSGDVSGMKRTARSRYYNGKWHEIVVLADEKPRKADGPVFASVERCCMENTKRTVAVVAYTDVMSQYDEKKVAEMAEIIAKEVQMRGGIEMKRISGASIQGHSTKCVSLYCGGDGIREADVSWVGLSDGKGHLRLSLRDTDRICEGSPFYAELMAK